MPAVILGEAVWKREFGADPHVAGDVLRLGAQTVRIAGVVPDGSLALPGKVDAWLLEPDSADIGRDGAPLCPVEPAVRTECHPAQLLERLCRIGFEHSGTDGRSAGGRERVDIINWSARLTGE